MKTKFVKGLGLAIALSLMTSVLSPMTTYAAAGTVNLQYIPREWNFTQSDEILAKEEALKKATAKTTMTADGTLTDNPNSMNLTGVNNTLTVQFNNLPAGYQNNIAFYYTATLEDGTVIDIYTDWRLWQTDNQVIVVDSNSWTYAFEVFSSSELQNGVTYDIANTYINPLLKCIPIIDSMKQTGAADDDIYSALADMMRTSYNLSIFDYFYVESFSNPAQYSIISSKLMVGVEYEFDGDTSYNRVGIVTSDAPVETPVAPPVETPVETPAAPETAVPTVQTNDIEKFAPVFNSTYYASVNPDIAAALGTDEALLFSHFLTFGMAEGRLCNEEFNVQVYKAANPDLVAAFGDDLTSYYLHYINSGQTEGRIAR